MSIQFFTPRGPKNEIIRLPTALRKTVRWLPQIGDVFPDFSVETTEGDLNFWEWAEGLHHRDGVDHGAFRGVAGIECQTSRAQRVEPQ